MIKLIRRLETLGLDDRALVGAKAAVLGEFHKDRIGEIPPGFVITAAGWQAYLKKAKLDPLIANTLKNLDLDGAKALNQACEKIVKAIREAPLGAKLEQAISSAYEALDKDEEAIVAVRPSLADHNLATAPLGGLHLTFLNVKGKKAVTAAVHKLFAKSFEPASLYYRFLHGLQPTKVDLAVICQMMVFPVVSGVVVTTDPLLHDPGKLLIEAVWGLGETLVNGTITPDRLIVDKHTLKVLSEKLEVQDWQLEYRQGKTAHVSVPTQKKEQAKLDPDLVVELTRLGKTIEEKLHQPQEVEWALDHQGKLWLLDSHPSVANPPAGRAGTTAGKSARWKIVPVATAKTIPPAGERPEPGSVGEVIVQGIPAGIGVATGQVVILHSAQELDKVKSGSVLVAEATNPAFIQAMRKSVAIVTDTGGLTSHAALFAREMGIACVVGTGQATHRLAQGQLVTVDGVKGVVYKGKIASAEIKNVHKVSDFGFRISDLPVITGTKVYVNLSEPNLAFKAAGLPVDGVGLVRSEFLIAELPEHPSSLIKQGKKRTISEHITGLVGQIAGAFAPRPVVYRLSDLKTSEYQAMKGGQALEPKEQNPMLGWRGARRYVDDPTLVSLELEAIAWVREKMNLTNLWVMVPYVRIVEELKQVIFLMSKQGLQRSPDFKVWMMVEIPANVILLDQFAGCGIDGISIGSNDLTQLTLGVDRENAKLADYDERDPAVLRLVTEAVAKARQLGLTASACGNAVSLYPEFLEALVRAGITSVSVTPDAANETRKLISSIEKRILLEHALI